MKKTYERPMMISEEFRANEYVATCASTGAPKYECIYEENSVFVRWVEEVVEHFIAPFFGFEYKSHIDGGIGNLSCDATASADQVAEKSYEGNTFAVWTDGQGITHFDNKQNFS